MCTFCLHSNSLQTLIRIVNLRRYNGSFSYLPVEHLGGTGGPYSSELEVNKLLQNNEADSARSWRKGYSGPLQSQPSSDWRSMDGVFVLVWLNNVPFAGETAMPAPLAKFSDGCLDLLVLRDCSRWELFGLLFKLQDGSHIKSKSIEYLKVALCS
jgi:sphingosine kinase